jgi:hypothetical protein
MDTEEKIHIELEACLNSINSGGIGNPDPHIIEKLDQISAAAAGLGMDQGKKLPENLSAVLKKFKEGQSGEESVAIRVTALDFYLQNTRSPAATEEL